MMNKKSGKRVLSWLLAAAMLIALMPANALAEPPTESSGSTETTVEFRCPDSEGSAEVSVGDYDSSTTAEALFKDVSSDVLSFDADSAEDSLKEGTIEGTDTPVHLDKAVVLEDGNVPETQEELEQEGTEISAVIKTDNDIAYLPATGGKPVDLGEDQTLVIIYTPEEETPDADADNQGEETKDEVTADGIASLIAPLPIDVYKDGYPVYVYGRFISGYTDKGEKNQLNNSATIIKDNTPVEISWNETGNYITIGKIDNVTYVNPNRHDATEQLKKATRKLKDLVPYENSDKNFNKDHVADWDLHTSPGATDYEYENTWTWHMDGDIHVYKVVYDYSDGTTTSYNDGKYYYGNYTVDNNVFVPTRKGYTFEGWTLDGKNVITSISNLKDKADTNDTVTLKAKWVRKASNYPVYVYGLFKNGTETILYGNNTTIVKDGVTKNIEWNDYATEAGGLPKSYYITFGKVDDVTTSDPNGENPSEKVATVTDKFSTLKDFTGTGGAKGDNTKNGFTVNDVSSWDLHTSPGATSYSDEVTTSVKSWHMDGTIQVYKVAYDKNAGNDIVNNMPEEDTSYYFGTYTVTDKTPKREGYIFTGWTLNGNKVGETVNLRSLENKTVEGITLIAQWKEKEKEPEYPVYVYGHFVDKNGAELGTGAELTVNDKAVVWNEDHTGNEYYITFGKIADATTATPSNGSTALFNIYKSLQEDGKILDALSSDNEGAASGYGLTWEIAHNWEDLKARQGAASYNETDNIKNTWTWHLDGAITVYRVTYTAGDRQNDASLKDMPTNPNSFYFNNYTIKDSDPEPTCDSWKFIGWKRIDNSDDNTLYKKGTENTSFAITDDVTLEAQWAPKKVVYKVNYDWGTSYPSDKICPSDEADYGSESEVEMDTTYNSTSTSNANKGEQEGLWTFSGWTERIESAPVYSNDVITTTITYKGTWTFTARKYQAVYSWTNAPTGIGAPAVPTDSTEYNSKADIFNSDKYKLYKDGDTYQTSEGIYTFHGWTEGEESINPDGTLTTITFTGKWTFSGKQYKVVYDWNGGDGVPDGVTLPSNNGSYYKSESVAKAAVDTEYTRTSTSTAKNGDKEGLWKFSGWTASSPVDSTTEENTAVITFTGTWTFTEKAVNVTYNWGTFSPRDEQLPHAERTYNTEAEAEADLDTNYTQNKSVSDTEGTWTFSGWKKNVTRSTDGNEVTIALTGSWTRTNYKVTYTWDGGDGVPSDFVNRKPVDNTYNTEADANAAIEAAKENFKDGTPSNMPNGNIAGSWKFSGWSTKESQTSNPANNDILVTIALTGSWAFEATDTETITGILNTLVQKSFTAQYNRSTSGTFTATAAVITSTEGVSVLKAPKTYTGTVTLDTGKEEHFTFTGENDHLLANTEYKIIVTEENTHQSYVTYDDAQHIITFETNHQGVVDPNFIMIDDDETIKNITFHNIYTYKRHHSSDDGDNGGKKEENPTVEITDDEALGLNNTDHFAYIVGYGNGEVRPQNSITRAEVAAIFFRLLEDDVRDANYTRQNKFTDVSNDAWYCSAVSTLSAMGIISGYPDATFRPNASITRAEFAAIATRFDVNGDKTPVSFSDIAGHWAKDEIAVAANNGWVNGYEDGSFRPQNKITRAETMSLVNRVLNRRPETAEDLLESMTKWTDNADTNAWYYLAVQEATNSHYYEYKENYQYEKWTELRETRDWSELDK